MTLRFLDTNILLYSISRDPTETAKRDRAVALIDAGGNALSVQVLQELMSQPLNPTTGTISASDDDLRHPALRLVSSQVHAA